MSKGILEEIRESGFSLEHLSELYLELNSLKGVPQNPEYHGEGDGFTHTSLVCQELIGIQEWKNLCPRHQELLFLAGAFHDIGKVVCTRKEEGKWVSPKHTIVGEKVFRALVYRKQDAFQLEFWERELVAKLIRYHGLPIWFWAKRRPEYSLIQAAEQIPLSMLYLLAKADSLGKKCENPEKLKDNLELFADYVSELGLWEDSYSFSNQHTKYEYFHKNNIWRDSELYDATQFDVWMLSGLPLSGKDSWIQFFEEKLPIVSLDDIRDELKILPGQHSAKVANIAIERAKKMLRKKQSFIWNATNIIEETRQKLCNLFASYGARTHLVYIEVPYLQLLSRNQKRDRYIPVTVLEKMIDKLELPAPWEAFQVDYCIDS